MASTEYPIPLDTTASCFGVISTVTPGACYITEAVDSLHDRLQLNLKNTAEIPATNHLRIYLFPIRNPPTKAPLTTFRGWTADTDFNEIETFENIAMDITLPNEFATSNNPNLGNSNASASATSSGADPSLVSATDVTYKFFLYTQFNDVPQYSMITIGYPQDWTLDCSLTYTVTSYRDCLFDPIAICNPNLKRLELMNGYDPNKVALNPGFVPYVMY